MNLVTERSQDLEVDLKRLHGECMDYLETYDKVCVAYLEAVRHGLEQRRRT
jgi:hypothetical protein